MVQAASLTAQQLLQQHWGYPAFRPGQAEIVEAIAQGRDCLIIWPTGGGKSLCFQVPALLRSGLTIVVTPLIALIENQVADLQARGIAAACLHSQMAPRDRKAVLQKLPQLKLLYLAPETLLSTPLWSRLTEPTIAIAGLILDEAHCLLQWGESFRPTYLRLGAIRPALVRLGKPSFPIAAFTATAYPQEVARLSQILQLQQPQRHQRDPYRSNLVLAVKTVWTPRQRQNQLLDFLAKHQGQSGLIYLRSRRDCETWADRLRNRGYRCAAYHAGVSDRERRQIEQAWQTGSLPFAVCSSAFGMGIDKRDVRWVAHVHPPLLLSEYLQEVGRGGRDQQRAQGLTLVSEPSGWLDPSDRDRWQGFQQATQQQWEAAQRQAQQLPASGDLRSLASSNELDLALAYLQRLGQLQWLDPFRYRRRAIPTPRPAPRLDLQPLRQFLYSRDCRWRSLLQSFGSNHPTTWRCGHCDRCQTTG
ncbi:RecQ family ATP-dependent DNA helicase [Synechococcus elongatus]|nr:RecQ family ATP-dependent DNA helicase [Synechococcus elongatus]AJD58158.1 ATP-dependent DNA helicase RecQ [Synechococcus elongatus UTEX 2973]MBD2587738.1 ATP-dependent DNA helicase RecQ [Synechococcus elongatus FACHB-242]MBD2688483.1 ATP-dependent DNA helicase RecQ [Synechococcus elongatus FACHB-1061]MBD2707554.1 ATP-dependent DNA helicase RecQ [Synechococcus elongatus PCC 7942 = FACHB-805]UOW71115.1 ATP-dependent DNA helicase RecQ [Synechococcus elongatus PCC 7943]